MKEYIDKSVLIAMCKGIAACEWNKKVAPVSWADAYERFADEVEDFDAADVVERKRGEWVPRIDEDEEWGTMEYPECSLCKKCAFMVTDFCPNCGADMRSHQNILCDQNEEVDHA